MVAQEFDRLLGGPAERECTSCGNAAANGIAAASDLDDLVPQLPSAFAQRIVAWRSHARVMALRDESRARLTKLIARTAQWLREGQASEEAAVRLTDWIEPLLRRESYLALLLERPNVHARLLRLLGAARWPARYLMLHPGVIDELANPDMLHERFDAAEFEHGLEQRRSTCARPTRR
jgi:glutamate-ammonia-ligase adenylyltransferase